MKKLVLHFTVLFALICIATACKKDDDDVQKQKASVVMQSTIAGVNGPTLGKVKQELTFNVMWQGADSTTVFDHLKDSVSGHTRMVKLYMLTNVVDTAVFKIPAAIAYKFKADTPGVYYLKFYKADNSDKTAIIDTLTIK